MQFEQLVTELTEVLDIGQLERRVTDPTMTEAVLDVVHDSRRVKPGTLFCAVPGLTVDGHDYLESAAEQGATAALVERFVDGKRSDLVDQVRVPSVRAAMGHAAAIVHGRPSHDLAVFGITGTNGKTTTTHLLSSIVRSVGKTCAVIGTLGGVHTTPESPDLQRRLRQLADAGTDVVALEVSSHALDQGRVDATRFAVAAFSNLTPDHLDYHLDMDSYFEAKSRLFDGRAVEELINADDPWGRQLAATRPNARTITVAGDVSITSETLDGTAFTWRGQETSVPLPGRMNVANALMAAEVALLLGFDEREIADGLSNAEPVAGRMQMVAAVSSSRPTVVVDYSHTPDSIERALATLRATMAGDRQLAIVFGCGGDRDRSKRPLMGQAAEHGADRVYLTSDNPRSEDPEKIMADALAGFERPEQVTVEGDRKAAISRAIIESRPGDVVLVAGKGHEKTQTIGGDVLPFDDAQIALALLEAFDS